MKTVYLFIALIFYRHKNFMKNEKKISTEIFSEDEIQQRIREMKENDKETGEDPASEEDYRQWAIEELTLNQSGNMAIQNDFSRKTFIGIRVIMTKGVALEDEETRGKIIKAVRDFKDFNEDNDPYGEHDFGKFNVQGTQYLWKIDYYDKSYTYHSPDKSNPEFTNRVLTIMRADEY